MESNTSTSLFKLSLGTDCSKLHCCNDDNNDDVNNNDSAHHAYNHCCTNATRRYFPSLSTRIY